MLTAGVDLAAEPKGTALAIIEWSEGAARLVELRLGMGDDEIVTSTRGVEKLGIDCALGWPREFVDFLTQHSNTNSHNQVHDGGIDWRRRLSYRETDRQVRQVTGRWPLSVATDRLGLTALRCAGLVSRLRAAGMNVDRSASGQIAEVYPGASLRLWGLDTTGYRASAAKREELLADIQAELPRFDVAGFQNLMVSSCDAFDAVVAALAARAVVTGRFVPPTQEQLPAAKVEGWIALPLGSLCDLLNPTPPSAS